MSLRKTSLTFLLLLFVITKSQVTVTPEGYAQNGEGGGAQLQIGLNANGIYNYWYSKDQDMYKGRSLGDTLTCSETTCPKPNECIENYNFCMCDKTRANYPFIGEDNKFCTYKRKRQLVAFLWELFTNVGVGHYYIHHIARGVFKSLMTATPIVIFVLGKLRLLKT